MSKSRSTLIVLLAALLAACDGETLFESRSDAKARQTLIGYWAWSYRQPASDRLIDVVTHRKTDGTWTQESTEREENGGGIHVEQSQGIWLVTDGVLKMRTCFIDDEPVAKGSRVAFRTYAIVSYEDKRAILQPSAENGVPGLWPRTIEAPHGPDDQLRPITQVRIERREESQPRRQHGWVQCPPRPSDESSTAG